jgi:hypothetical protein
VADAEGQLVRAWRRTAVRPTVVVDPDFSCARSGRHGIGIHWVHPARSPPPAVFNGPFALVASAVCWPRQHLCRATTIPPATFDSARGAHLVCRVVWPCLQAVNLSVVPLEYRLLFINVASLFWSAYLSNMANSGAAPATPLVAMEATSPAAAAPTNLK